MPVEHRLQPSFNNGEVSPLLYDRVDFQKFVSSVKSGKNMFVHAQGGMSNRAGTVMLAQAKDEKVLLVPFEFSSTETYVIEFGDGYCRFFTANGQVVTEVEEGGVTVQVPYEIASPFTTADLSKIRYCQSGDVMYIAWGGKPQTLTRYGHTNWRMSDYDYKKGPFNLENFEEDKHLSVTYDSDKLLYNITSDFDAFDSRDVGRYIKYKYNFKGQNLHGAASTATPDYHSGNVLCSGMYEIRSTGTWAGSIKIEYSNDLVSWKTERDFAGNEDNNLNFSGALEEGLWWVRVSADITSGAFNYTFVTQSFDYDLIFRIQEYDSVSSVYATSEDNIANLENIISTNSSSEIIDVIPDMTSNTTPSGTAYSTVYTNDAWKAFHQTAWNNKEEMRTSLYCAEGEDISFGYSWGTSNPCYVSKLYIKVMLVPMTTAHIEVMPPSSLSRIFSSFQIYYSLNNSTKQNISFTSRLDSVQPGVGSTFVIELSQLVLMDDLFITATSQDYEGSLPWRFYFGSIGCKGFEYTPSSPVSNFYNSSFAFGEWADSTYYPTEVDLYQDRITWATNNQLDATKISDYTNFGVSTDVTEDDAISVIVKDKKVDKINSIVAGQKLAVFSDDGNFVHNNDTFTSQSATFLKQGATGGSDVKPVVVRDHIIYAHPMKQAVSDYAYNFETDGYAGQDITLLANHLFDGKVIKTLAYQQEPYSIIWVLLEDGTVLSCTYLRQQQVIAWTPMDFGGQVKSIAVCSTGTEEHLYLAVKRKNGTFVEKMPTRLLTSDPKECFFVDCGRTYRGEPATVISGLGYLEGEQVSVLADGNVVNGLTVENGSITIPVAASIVTVGLPYESVLETLTFDANMGDGTTLNRKKRVVALSVRYNQSRGSKVSVNGHREIDMLKREQEAYNTPISLKSGVYREILPSTHNASTNVKIRQIDPLPITIVSVIPEIEYER